MLNYQFKIEANGVTRFGFPTVAIDNALLLRAPLHEQEMISGYIDRETARIDALIGKKRRLLELLEEKRLAVITHAVTKGLDPNAPMKDSGIEWLGRIPAHWEAKRLRFVMETIEQGWSPLSNNYPAEDDEWGVLKVGCVNGTTFDQSENKALPSDLAPREHYEISSGDILMSRANTKELLGSAAIVQEVRPKLLLCDKLYRLVVSAHIDRQFAGGTRLRANAARMESRVGSLGAIGSGSSGDTETVSTSGRRSGCAGGTADTLSCSGG
jgi:type I restriction enzyme, S subunit